LYEDDDSVFAALRAGARGYILKDTDEDEMVRASSLTRLSPLTTRETVDRDTPAIRAISSRFNCSSPSSVRALPR
jgi:DNA-binding NarL/FixJ family response regulator